MKEQTEQSDQIESFFSTPTFQALTIGVPFCIFKLLFGLLALRAAAEQRSATLTAFGWLIVAWAATDLLMNLARVAFHLSGRASPVEYCMIAQTGRLFGRPRLFLAFDTLISFSIICFVLLVRLDSAARPGGILPSGRRHDPEPDQHLYCQHLDRVSERGLSIERRIL